MHDSRALQALRDSIVSAKTELALEADAFFARLIARFAPD
jgi:hypothetical protein